MRKAASLRRKAIPRVSRKRVRVIPGIAPDGMRRPERTQLRGGVASMRTGWMLHRRRQEESWTHDRDWTTSGVPRLTFGGVCRIRLPGDVGFSGERRGEEGICGAHRGRVLQWDFVGGEGERSVGAAGEQRQLVCAQTLGASAAGVSRRRQETD